MRTLRTMRTRSTHPQHDDRARPVVAAAPTATSDDDVLEVDGRPTFALVQNG